ncbi:hypothetical protein SLE2022_293320 [Rubroshorea leprosula]
MDTKTTGLAKSHSRPRSFFDDDDDDDEHELHSFDFRPSRSHQYVTLDPTRFRDRSSIADTDSLKDTGDRIGASFVAALIHEIDGKIKEHMDTLLHAVGGLNARVTQMETRTRQLENAVDELKDSVEFNHGRTEGKLRDLHNILEEVQGGICDLRDKQEIAEAQRQLAKLKASQVEQQSGKQNSSIQTDSGDKVPPSVPQQTHQPFPIPVNPQQPSPLPSGTLPNLYQNLPSAPAAAPLLPNQLPRSKLPSLPHPESNHPPSTLTPEMTFPRYQIPSTQQMQPPFPDLHQSPSQLSPSFSSHLPQPCRLTSMVNSQLNPPLGHQPEAICFLPSQSFYKSSQQPGRSPLAHHFYAAPGHHIQDQPSGGPYSEIIDEYSRPPGHSIANNLGPIGASPSTYSDSATKPSLLPPSSSSGIGNNYSQLPTAKILPLALPTAVPVDAVSSTGDSGNRVPIDDVVDRVVAMGFRRDLVRATVRKLTANGQSVDFNLVLDKLMNSGDK